jgi:hypothetical protein
MGTIISFKGAVSSHLSSSGGDPDKQSLFSLNQAAIFSGNHQLAGLSSHVLHSFDTDINFLRIYEREVKYELVTLSSANRAPPSFIS